MACILHIETSATVCSVAVSENGQCIFDQADHSGPNHAERLGTMMDEAISFTDNHGIPFDPTKHQEADVEADLDDRPIGGLGIYLVKNIMDTMTYQRTPDGYNVVTLTKQIK